MFTRVILIHFPDAFCEVEMYLNESFVEELLGKVEELLGKASCVWWMDDLTAAI